MKKTILSAALLAAFTGQALAADIPARTYSKAPVYTAPAVVYNWTGFYIGGHVGGAFAGDNALVSNDARFLGGVQAGFDYQFAPNWVLGAEAQYPWLGGGNNNNNGVLFPGGTLVTATESELMLFREPEPGKPGKPRETKVSVGQVGNKPALEAASTWGGPAAAAAGAAVGTGPAGAPVSRGYKEEMADFAVCIRQWNPSVGYQKATDPDTKKERYAQRLPRCHGEVAMADAIVALTANLAMKKRSRIEFKPEWFDFKSDEVPEGKTEKA